MSDVCMVVVHSWCVVSSVVVTCEKVRVHSYNAAEWSVIKYLIYIHVCVGEQRISMNSDPVEVCSYLFL